MGKNKKQKFRHDEMYDANNTPDLRKYEKKKVSYASVFIGALLSRLILIAVFSLFIFIIFIGLIAVFENTGVVIPFLIVITVLIIALSICTRVIRRRMEFVRKLKKLCRTNGYTFEPKMSFWESMKLVPESEVSFLLSAEGKNYYVKYVTPKRPLTTVTFISGNELKYTKHPRKNVFTAVFDRVSKSITVDFTFPDYIANDPNAVKVMLVNPMPMDICKKDSDGSVVPTGTGEEIYGYTIYTGTGLIEAVNRDKNYK